MNAIARPVDLFAGMNGTEKARAIELEAMKRSHLIASWRYEKVTLLLADDTRYTPDFLVIDLLGAMLFEETKGFWRDDALVKIKVAAALYPEFRFRSLVAKPKKLGGGWDVRDFQAPLTSPRSHTPNQNTDESLALRRLLRRHVRGW